MIVDRIKEVSREMHSCSLPITDGPPGLISGHRLAGKKKAGPLLALPL